MISHPRMTACGRPPGALILAKMCFHCSSLIEYDYQPLHSSLLGLSCESELFPRKLTPYRLLWRFRVYLYPLVPFVHMQAPGYG